MRARPFAEKKKLKRRKAIVHLLMEKYTYLFVDGIMVKENEEKGPAETVFPFEAILASAAYIHSRRI